MLSFGRTARRVRELDAELDAHRAETRLRLEDLHEGIHRSLASPTAVASSFALGIVAGHFHRRRPKKDERPDSRGKRSRMHAPLHYARWGLRMYLTQKTAAFLRSIA
ncbi:hypothetical protein BH24PSE2_BH24PSE2_17560 [soil metagenome]